MGINETLSQAASDMANFDVRTDGALVTRSGVDFSGNGIETLSYIANDTTTPGVLSDVVQIFFIKGRRFVQTRTGLWYGGASTFWRVDNKVTINGEAVEDDDLWTTAYWTDRYHVVVANKDRAFLANGKNQFWLDLQFPAGAEYPVLYNWGMDAPDRSQWTAQTVDSGGEWTGGTTDITLDNTGGTIEAGFYAYALCYQNQYGGMSPLSARAIIQQERDVEGDPQHKNRATLTYPIPADKQVKYINIYRTDKLEPIPSTVNSEIEGTLAQSAPLKLIRQYNISAAIAASTPTLQDTDATRAYGIAQLASTEFTSKPPSSLNHITHYAGRIWGSMVQDSEARGPDILCFSAIDGSAAPLYDIWPLAKSEEGAGTNPATDANLSPAIPHQIKTRDLIRAIGHSRNYIAIFGDTSIQLGKGQGVIEGLYNVNLPNTDLDFSDFLDGIGGKEFCVSERNGNLYFLSPSDVRVYRLDVNGQVSWISAPIQQILNGYGSSRVKQVLAHDEMVHVLVNNTTTKKSDLYAYEESRGIWTHQDLSSSNLSNLTSNILGGDYIDRGNSNFGLTDSAANLNGAIADGLATAVTVTDGSLFEDGDVLDIEGDQMHVTDISTHVLTVTRGSNGTTPVGHDDATDVFLVDPDVTAISHTGLYAMGEATGGNTVLFRLFDDDSTNDDGAVIPVSYTSEEFIFANPTRINLVRVGVETDSSVTVNIDVDGEESQVTIPNPATTADPYILSKENNYGVRAFARGHKFKVRFTLSGAQTVRFFELQFRSR